MATICQYWDENLCQYNGQCPNQTNYLPWLKPQCSEKLPPKFPKEIDDKQLALERETSLFGPNGETTKLYRPFDNK